LGNGTRHFLMRFNGFANDAKYTKLEGVSREVV
jgi:hypothetical protein